MEANFSSAMCLQIDQVILMHEWIYFNGRSVVLSVLILMNLISIASVFSKVRYYWHSNVYDRFSFPNSSDVHFVLTNFFCIIYSYWDFWVTLLFCVVYFQIQDHNDGGILKSVCQDQIWKDYSNKLQWVDLM